MNKTPSAGTVAATIVGMKTANRGKLVESAKIEDGMVRVTFAGTGSKVFRSALYTPAEAWNMVAWATPLKETK